MKKHYNVSAAVIIHDNKFLCVQRSESKFDYISFKFEFPGGKIEAGEDETSALIREIKEELNLEIEVVRKLIVVEHEYPDFSIKMHTYLCKAEIQGLTLKEHIGLVWHSRVDLDKLDWAEADIPIVNTLMNNSDEIFK